MQQEYNNIYRQAVTGRSMFFAMLDKPNDPMAGNIRQQVLAIADDVKDGRHPRSVEERIKQLHRHLSVARQGNERVMRVDENVTLHDHYERLRRGLRQLPNY